MKKTPDASSPWKNLDQAAAYLGRGRRFVAREVKAGRLRAARIGGRGEILVRSEWLDAYVLEQSTVVELPARRRA
jgi:excisionase family DNA binding protein